MSRRTDPPSRDEPLTPEERAWARRLALVGPHEGPSPALDAKVIAAAQAAVATPVTVASAPASSRRMPRRHRQRRWPMLVGAAASLVIVVGLAWQLQPLLRTRPSVGEGPVAPASLPRSESTLSAEVLAAADPVARRPGLLPAPVAASAPGSVDSSPPPSPPAPASPPRPRAPATTVPRAAPDFGDDAIPPYRDFAGTTAARQAAATVSAADASSARATPSAHQDAAAVSAPHAFPAQQQDGSANAAAKALTPSPPAPPSAPSATRTETQARRASARNSSESSGTDSAGTSVDSDSAADRPPSLADRRVETDRRLLPAAWLQRIRDRRDAGDPGRALASLALFRKTHPEIRVPDDLARLDR